MDFWWEREAVADQKGEKKTKATAETVIGLDEQGKKLGTKSETLDQFREKPDTEQVGKR